MSKHGMSWRARGAVAAASLAGGFGAVGSASAATVDGFDYGQMQAATVGAAGCGTNPAGEPALHVSRTDNVFVGAEDGLGGGSQLWRGLGAVGGAGASGCGLEYRGQPNAIGGVGASGGDIDLAIASAPNASGNYNLYVSSLNLGSVNVATSPDNAPTFSQTPVQAGLPLDDREWIAAFGADTSLLTYHDIATNDIDVLRSDDGGAAYTQISQVIPETDYKAANNELGNLVIDHRNLPAGAGNFYAYQAFVAPSRSSGTHNNEAFLGVSSDDGHTWTDRPIPCSTASATTDLNHNFPNVSVDPAGKLWYAWSDDKTIHTATSSDHGQTWSCSKPVSTGSAQAIFPWLAASSRGVDLVYYGAPTKTNQTWYAYFAQNTTGRASGWAAPHRLMAVHKGAVCEGGVSCTGGRQLFDDFAVDTDNLGFAHIAYSHDSPNLGGSGTYTGYAVQTTGKTVGQPNN
ncbi:MAG: hypothetical protein ACRDK8_14375 [Solirubrobacteraceae bacterium]